MASNKQAAKGKQKPAEQDEQQDQVSERISGGSADAELDMEDIDESDLEIEDIDESEIEDEDTDEIDESAELDELISMLEESDLTDLDAEEGIEALDEWYEILNDSGDSELKEIGKGLRQLKKTLSAKKQKPHDISEALSQLGEQIDGYANNAQRGYKTKLHKLAKSLSKSAKSIEKASEE
jgi:hypothetical protein